MKTFDIVAHGRHSKLSLPLFYVLLKSFLSQLNSLYPGDKVTAGGKVTGSRFVCSFCHDDLTNIYGCAMYT